MLRHFVLLLLCALAVPGFAQVSLELRSETSVDGARYRLGDIAQVRSADKELEARLAALELGVSPRAGRQERVTQRQVMRIVEAKLPAVRGKLVWHGAKLSTIRTDGMALDTERITDLACTALREHLEREYIKVELEAVGSLRNLVLPVGAELKVREQKWQLGRRMPVWVDLDVGGQIYASVPVWFAVQAWKEVPVARSDMASGSALRGEDFTLLTIDVAGSPALLDSIPPQNALRLRAPVRSGAPVNLDAVEALPPITRHQHVAVRLETDTIVIETAGIAQGDGRVGETVKVRSAGGNETFLANVLAPGLVAVNMR